MARGGKQQEPLDWVTRAADDAIRHAAGSGDPAAMAAYVADGGLVTVASGASPSGPIHLGNLREFLTPHFVAEELRRRGVRTRHLHSWDDFDRFRKVGAGVPPEWAEHIGKPLTAVPDPFGCHDNWAEHFKAPLRAALPRWASRWRRSPRPSVPAGCLPPADPARRRAARRPSRACWPATARRPRSRPRMPRRPRRSTDAVTASEDLDRFPYKPYCRRLRPRHDVGHGVRRRDPPTSPTPARAGYAGTTNLATAGRGQAGLEGRLADALGLRARRLRARRPGPRDARLVVHGRHELVERSSACRAPAWFGYGFVGFAGMQKMSSSAGGAPTAADALRVLEAPILRWLYVRRSPSRPSHRLRPRGRPAVRRVGRAGRKAATREARRRRCSPSSGPSRPRPPAPCPVAGVVVPFRVLAGVADVTAGSAEQISRIVGTSARALLGRPTSSPGCRAMGWTSSSCPSRAHDRALRPRRRSGSRRSRRRRRSGSRCSSTASPRASSSWSR
jgi:lysyl-tRNA synthetase class 1